ncbi:MAG: hypothetical protein MAGBODY4_01184 [Candidatus Marinimicrobia bacterium]|nr:hypothetical protein [Candidatus Neomarinimicrobiota bacterium]
MSLPFLSYWDCRPTRDPLRENATGRCMYAGSLPRHLSPFGRFRVTGWLCLCILLHFPSCCSLSPVPTCRESATESGSKCRPKSSSRPPFDGLRVTGELKVTDWLSLVRVPLTISSYPVSPVLLITSTATLVDLYCCFLLWLPVIILWKSSSVTKVGTPR